MKWGREGGDEGERQSEGKSEALGRIYSGGGGKEEGDTVDTGNAVQQTGSGHDPLQGPCVPCSRSDSWKLP